MTKQSFSVIPAKAGIQLIADGLDSLPMSIGTKGAGMTTISIHQRQSSEELFNLGASSENDIVVQLESGARFKGVIILPTQNRDVKFIVNLRQGSHAEIYTLVVGRNSERGGLQIIMNHLEPETRGNVAVKAVLDGEARFNFDGLIKIDKAAQKTQSYLREDVLLLSAKARSFGQPRLEIAANDVKASHGSAVGRIDEEQLFYLASHGVGPDDGRRLIVRGFIDAIVSKITDVSIRDKAIKNLLSVSLRAEVA